MHRYSRRHLPWLLLITCCALAPALVSFAQTRADPVVFFGAYALRLGMPQESVLKDLGAEYRLISTGQDNWAVLEKDPSLPGGGSIAFKARRLSYVNRIWVQHPPPGNGSSEPMAIPQAFFGVVSNFVRENRRTCTLGTHEGFAPGGEGRTAYLVCGGKEIRIMLARTPQFGWIATVEEVMPGTISQ